MNQDSRWHVRAIERLDTRRLLSAEDPSGDGELIDPPFVDDPTITVDPSDTTGTDPLVDLGFEPDILIYTCFFPVADGGEGTDGGDNTETVADGGDETIDPNAEPVIFTCGTGDPLVDDSVLVDPITYELYPATDDGVTVEEPSVDATVEVDPAIEEVERTNVDVIDVEATSIELTSAPQVAERVDEAPAAAELAPMATATATFSNTRIRDSFELIASSDVLA